MALAQVHIAHGASNRDKKVEKGSPENKKTKQAYVEYLFNIDPLVNNKYSTTYIHSFNSLLHNTCSLNHL